MNGLRAKQGEWDAARRAVGEALSSLPEPLRSESLASFTVVRSEIGELRKAINEVVTAAERLSRPGVTGNAEMLLATRMTTALQDAALVIGSHGVFPEIRHTS